MSNSCVDIDPCTDTRWEAFVSERDAPIYLGPMWLRILRTVYGFEPQVLACLHPGGAIRSAICFVHISDLLGDRLASLPFCDYADPVLDTPEDWDIFVAALQERYPDVPLTVRVTHQEIVRQDPRFANVRDAILHRLDLSEGFESYWKHATKDYRKAVRKAVKGNVEVQVGDDLESVRRYYRIHQSNRGSRFGNLVQPIPFFEALWKSFVSQGNGFVMVAERDGEALAATLYLVANGVLYDKFSASLKEGLPYRPNNLLLHEGARWACDRGLRAMDLGLTGASNEGLLHFKDSCGASRYPLNFMRKTPARYDGRKESEGRELLNRLAGLFTEDGVPAEVTERAGALLYQYFA